MEDRLLHGQPEDFYAMRTKRVQDEVSKRVRQGLHAFIGQPITDSMKEGAGSAVYHITEQLKDMGVITSAKVTVNDQGVIEVKAQVGFSVMDYLVLQVKLE